MFTIICHCGLVMRKRNVIGVAIVRSKSSPVQSSPVVQSTDYRQPEEVTVLVHYAIASNVRILPIARSQFEITFSRPTGYTVMVWFPLAKSCMVNRLVPTSVNVSVCEW